MAIPVRLPISSIRQLSPTRQKSAGALPRVTQFAFRFTLRKVILLIPLIFILPNFFENKALAVFLAEPISDFIAAAVTTFMFFRFFIKMLKEGKAGNAA